VTKTKVDLLFDFFLLGRKIKFKHKNINKDQFLETAILKILANQALSVSEVAEICCNRLSATSEKLAKLKKAALITIVKTEDARKTKYKLSQKGKSILKQRLKKVALHNPLANKLSEKEMKILFKLMKKISN